MRTLLAVMCGAIMTAFGAAGVLLRYAANSDPDHERTFCRSLLYCDDEVLGQEVHRLLWSADRELESNAIEGAKEFLRRNPASAGRWCTLGDAYLRSGSIADARYAYARAIDRGPNSPPVLMRAAHFYWESGDAAEYLRHSSKVLSLVPDYDAVIFGGYSRAGLDARQVIRAGQMMEAGVAARYFEYLSAWGETAEAELVTTEKATAYRNPE